MADPVLPALSVSRTDRTYVPSGRPLRLPVNGDEQFDQSRITRPALVIRHCAFAPFSPDHDHVGVLSLSGDAGWPDSTGAAGAFVSRVYVDVAVGLTLPAMSVNRTAR